MCCASLAARGWGWPREINRRGIGVCRGVVPRWGCGGLEGLEGLDIHLRSIPFSSPLHLPLYDRFKCRERRTREGRR